MSSIEKNLNELSKIQEMQQRSHWMNELHPLGKLLVSVLYIVLVASINKYDIVILILMSVYLMFIFVIGDLSFRDGIYRMRLVLPLVIFVGIFNPFFDKTVLFYIGKIGITTGMLSMLTLVIKGVYTVLAAYSLIITTSIDDICYAFGCIKMPKIMILVIMLIYRYFGVMAEEAGRITTAYSLRAPSQKGIQYSAWGTLVGQWLLRSMDRAERVYESMLLRGFKGDFNTVKKKVKKTDIIFPVVWIVIFILIRWRVIL